VHEYHFKHRITITRIEQIKVTLKIAPKKAEGGLTASVDPNSSRSNLNKDD